MANGQIDLSFGGFNALALVRRRHAQEGNAEVEARGPVLGRRRRHRLVDLLQPGLHRQEVPRAVRRDRSSCRPCRWPSTAKRPASRSTSSRARSPRARMSPQGHRVPRQRRRREGLHRLARLRGQVRPRRRQGELLDELGLKDKDGDGFREFPDGSKLTCARISRPTPRQEHKSEERPAGARLEGVGIDCQDQPGAADLVRRQLEPTAST